MKATATQYHIVTATPGAVLISVALTFANRQSGNVMAMTADNILLVRPPRLRDIRRPCMCRLLMGVFPRKILHNPQYPRHVAEDG